MFFSVLKWTILSIMAGLVIGTATSFFIKILEISTGFTAKFQWYYLLMPLAFFISVVLIKYLAPDAEGHGTEKVIEAIHKKSGNIEPAVVPVKLLATVITLASGGSVGKEGPSAQIGAGIASIMANFFRMDNHDRKKLVICGISAGFAAVFGLPISGAIFGIEILFIGRILYDVLLPSLIAGITSYEVSLFWGIKPLRVAMDYPVVPTKFPYYFAAGLFFGLVSIAFITLLKKMEKFSHGLNIWKPFKGIIGGILMIGLTFIFSKQFLGLGSDPVVSTLNGSQIVWYSFLAKMVFTAVTLSFGGSGGIITPLFFIGITAGSMFANIFHLNNQVFAALGMIGIVAASTNAPITAIIMSAEIFGPTLLLPAAIVATISFLINGHNSVYPSQILAMKKSISLDVETDEEIRRVESKFIPRKGLIYMIYNYIRKLFSPSKN